MNSVEFKIYNMAGLAKLSVKYVIYRLSPSGIFIEVVKPPFDHVYDIDPRVVWLTRYNVMEKGRFFVKKLSASSVTFLKIILKKTT